MFESHNVTPTDLQGLLQSVNIQIGEGGKFNRFQRVYREDRLAFVHDCMPVLGKSITPYQEEILGLFDSGVRRVAVRGPHGLGKTFLASILVHHMVLTSEEDSKTVTTASVNLQLEKYLWPEIKKTAKFLAWDVVGRHPYVQSASGSGELMRNSIRLQGDLVEAFACSPADFAYVEGAHARRLLYVFDEAKTIPDGMWDAAEGAFSTEGIESTNPDFAGTSECYAFAISTPGAPSGKFYDIHMRKAGLEDWYVRHVTLDEAIAAGRISARWAEKRRLEWGETSSRYQNRVLGEFADSSEEGVIPLSWINAAIERKKQWEANGSPELYGVNTIGVDTARFGEDKTVFAVRNASLLQSLRVHSKLPTTVTARKLTNFIRVSKLYGTNYAVHIETDGGLGAAVYDILRDGGQVGKLKAINVSAPTLWRDSSGELAFENVRAAMWWNMRELLDPINGIGVMLPDIPELKRDLSTPRWDDTRRGGKILLESKKEIRKRIGCSTDYGDACCLAFWGGSSSGGGVVF